MASYVDLPGDAAWQGQLDDIRDPMLIGFDAQLDPSGYARDHFTGTSGIVDDEFANFLDRGAAEAQRAMYAREAAERARAAQRRREREERMNGDHNGPAAHHQAGSGPSRGIQRRRRAVTQRANRDRAFQSALDHHNRQDRNFSVSDEEFESVEQGQAALQPVTDGAAMTVSKMNTLDTEEGNREYPVPDSPFMEQRLVDLIREAELSGEEENYGRVEAMRKALATYRAIKERKRRREGVPRRLRRCQRGQCQPKSHRS
jgi:transglutaminase-like putative cysteine protease